MTTGLPAGPAFPAGPGCPLARSLSARNRAVSNVADKLIFSSLALDSKTLFMLTFAGFWGMNIKGWVRGLQLNYLYRAS